MQISVESDVKKIEKDIHSLFKRQIPFAASNAINKTAFDVRGREIAMMPVQLDKPTPFTLRGVQVKKGNKRTQKAVVFIADNRGYLHYQIVGGTRLPKNRAVTVPTRNARLNKYGNMARGKLKRLLNDNKVFSGKPKGGDRPSGLWKRTNSNKKLKPLVLYGNKATYKGGRFKFYELGHKEIEQVFGANFISEFNRAVRTAR